MSLKHKTTRRYNPSNKNHLPTKYNLPIRRNRILKSTISKAHPNSISVRTTIPQHIAELLEWFEGDILAWEIEKNGDKYVVKIRRLE
ncbi:MAG: hypothetical protein ACRD38_08665 [Nitrososphaerales archaeon]